MNNKNLSLKVQSIGLGKIIAIVAAGIVGLALLNFLFNYSLVSVTFSGNAKANSNGIEAQSFDNASGAGKELMKLGDRFIVARNTESILFKAGAAESLYTPEGAFGLLTDSAHITLQDPVSGTKISSGGESCLLVNSTDVYSYTCINPTSPRKYQPIQGYGKHVEVASVDSGEAAYQAASYRNGVLVIEKIKEQGKAARFVLRHIVPGVQTSQMELPDKFYDEKDYLVIVTDKVNTANTGFILYNQSSGISYHYRNFGQPESSKQINRIRQLNGDTESSSCTLLGTTYTCFHGHAGVESHNHSEELRSTPKTLQHAGTSTGVIEVVDVNSSSLTPRSYKGPDEYGISELAVTGGGLLYGISGTQLDRIQLDGNSFRSAFVADHIKLIEAGEHLYYVYNEKIYRYEGNSRTSSLLYKKDAETISDIITYGSSVYILSYDKKDPVQLLNVTRLQGQNER